MATGLLIAAGLAVAQFVPAFVTLDSLFRWGDMDPRGLSGRVRRWALLYGGLALLSGALGAWAQWRWAGAPALALLNPVPWWLLWRFGLRKQLTFLYKHDGGQDATNPDP